ncbi:MAG: preprotein translocase subunit SecE [Cryomorphaceae bacterium]|nr:MAG: preprotein translocase subunit SecE [Cryomorphaceae bacterium]
MKAYIIESYEELVHKVTWPTWKELQSSSILVLIASIIIALLVFLMDYIFGVNAVQSGDVNWKGVLGYIYEILIG